MLGHVGWGGRGRWLHWHIVGHQEAQAVLMQEKHQRAREPRRRPQAPLWVMTDGTIVPQLQ